MEISIGIYAVILIFFFIIVPGYIARRSYFHGEFSKQVKWSDLTIGSMLSSFFIGIILLAFFIALVNFFSLQKIDVDSILNKVDSFIIAKSENEKNTVLKFSGFTNSAYNYYFPFAIAIYIFSAFTCYIFSKLVVFFNLDVKYKIFRYSNAWHYLFYGRVLEFKNYKGSRLIRRNIIKSTYLDVLVAEQGDKASLYSGLFADYDINFNDINKLERLYLYKAVRYKKTQSEVVIKEIPGDVFTILGDKILNINARYLYYNSEERLLKKYNHKRFTLLFFQFSFLFFFFLLSISFLLSWNLFNTSWYKTILESSLWYKIVLIFAVNLLGGVITPFTDNKNLKKIKYIGNRMFAIQLLLFIVFVLALYRFW